MFKLRNPTLPALLAGAALLPGAALADDYRSQLTLGFDRALFDSDDSPDADVYRASFAYFFKRVPTDGLPLAEAAFLNRSSAVSAGISHLDFGDLDPDAFGLQVDYYLPGTMFYGRLNATHSDDFGSGSDTFFSGALGITPMDGLRVTTDVTEDGWDPNATAKYVGKMGNSHFYAASVSVVDPDDDDLSVGLDFDYFIDHTFSVGGGYSTGDDGFAVRARKFFTPKFAVGGHLSSGDSGDGFGADVTWRF